MAFTIKVEQVISVRIGDEWAGVEDGSFRIDSMIWDQEGQEVGNREMGFRAVLSGGGGLLAAPMSSLTGVRYKAE